MIKVYTNGMEQIQIFYKFFPGRKVKLRRTQRFGEAIHKFSQVIRRGISDSEEKEYLPGKSQGYVKSYLSFKEIPFENLKEDWYILGRITETVNELRMLAKDAGLYYKEIETTNVLMKSNGKQSKLGLNHKR